MSLLLSSSLFNIENSSMANDIIQTPEGDYIIVGRVYDTNGNDSGFSTRITPSGTIVWEQTYSSSFALMLKSVALLADGSYIATGSYFYSKYAGDEYIWIVNFNGEGNIIWQAAFGDVGVQSDGYDIKATKDGGFIVSGISVEESTLTWVLKFDSKGNLQWENKYNIGTAFSITQTIDEGYALTGFAKSDSFNSSPFIIRLDPKGKIVWEKIYNDIYIYDLFDSDIIETSNGHFAIVARTALMEVDASGNQIWVYQNEDFRLSTIVQTSDGNYCISGDLVVNYYEHAYIAILNRESLIKNLDKKIIWDNVEIDYNSSFNSVFEDKNGWLVGCGFIPVGVENLECFFSVFDPNQNVL